MSLRSSFSSLTRLNTQSNTTRIETAICGPISGSSRKVWIPNPIQQGLKQNIFTIAGTRNPRLNTQSNTTRIETSAATDGRRHDEWVWIPNPIQQGLKLDHGPQAGAGSLAFEYPIQYNKDWNSSKKLCTSRFRTVWIPNPIQQGLKHLGHCFAVANQKAFEYPIQYNKDWNITRVPATSGLRTCLNTQSNTTRIETPGRQAAGKPGLRVWIPNPIQQGLKRHRPLAYPPIALSLNTQSNTTRIETNGFAAPDDWTPKFEYPIQYNKDWNPKRCWLAAGPPTRFEYPIQYNKDWNFSSALRRPARAICLNTQSNTTRIETRHS